jgi:(p)ppGpp synthase/HD superfamily hydrolase
MKEEGIRTTTHPLVESALTFAAQAHRDHQRKGSGIPYIVHPVGVMLLLMQADEDDPEVLAAALLHDTLEDAGVTQEVLAATFGPRVAAIVAGATEPFARDEEWIVRKQHTIDYLPTAPREVQLVAAADKLHNITTMVNEHAEVGDALWARFNSGRANIAWYYREISVCLQRGELRGHPLVRQLALVVDQFFGGA